MICEICKNDFEKLGQHIGIHGITIKDYYKKYISKCDEDPKCPTCGKPLAFSSLTVGFQKYCSMHCRNTNSDWKKLHDEKVLKRFGSLRNTNDAAIRKTKNEATKNKLAYAVKDYGTIISYETPNIIYRCNKCQDEKCYTYNYFSHRIRYGMNPCNVCQKTLLNFKQSSRQEEELYNFIKANTDLTVERHNRKVLDGQELDIFIPELKLAFEYDGTYWHMDKRFYKETDFHKVKGITAAELWADDNHKNDLCAEKFIKLYRIAEYDWVTNTENIKANILTLLRR